MTKDPDSTPSAGVGFSSLGLAEPIVRAVAALGYEEATPIQREAIPVLLDGRDIIGQAGTGTGKTAAFVLPMLHRLLEVPGDRKGVRALVLVPTRELAMQVAEAVHKYAKQTSLTVVPLYGGAPMGQQIRVLTRGVDIVVATPGRALDHLRRQTLDLKTISTLVLDEADEMLDMGFAEDLEAILTATPESKQTALFAATMAPRIATIATRHLRTPVRITIKAEKRAAGKMPLVRQVAYVASRQQKPFALGRILEFEDPTSAIVFCRTRIEVDELTDTLKSHGYGAQALHGGLDQRQRDRVMHLFRTGKSDVLVATDVAARGLDIDHVSHVINYDIPTAPEVYVHRIGRTGRIGREGVAITLVGPREQRTLRDIEKLIKQRIDVVALPTLAALRAKRLDTARAALTTRIAAGDLDEARALVRSLSDDFEVVDIAAAAVALYQTESEGATPAAPEMDASPPSRVSRQARPPERARDRDRDRDRRPARPAKPAAGVEGRAERPARKSATPRSGLGPDVSIVVLAFSVGRNDGVNKGDLVGAITGESGVTSKVLGKIRLNPEFSVVEVDASVADKVERAMKGKKIRGEKVDVRKLD